ncbi:DnaJ-like proiein [Sarotherodon galilaeus]
MEFVEKLGIKVPNAVIVRGVTGSEKDEEIFEFLKQYGSISRVLTIDDQVSEFNKDHILEYNSGVAVQTLGPLLPYVHPSAANPDVVFSVHALTDVYSQRVGGSVTDTYLSELRGIAKLSGKEFEDVLREVMTKIEKSVGVAEESVALSTEVDIEEADHTDRPSQTPATFNDSAGIPVCPKLGHTDDEYCTQTLSSGTKRSLTLNPGELNPPEVQRIVVEYIVKSDDKMSRTHSILRLRAFSGKIPRPYNEADYDTWRSHVDLMMEDTSSLLIPASDVVRHLGPEAPPSTYLQLLDSAFGTVEDGEELLVRFMNTLQDPGEKPSAYLHCLQVALNRTVRRGGVQPQEVDKHLLKQFYRGCWDHDLLAVLQVELKNREAPSLAELLLLLTESESSDLSKLKKQVADLKSQLTALMKQRKTTAFKKEHMQKDETKKPDHAKTEPGPPPHSVLTVKPKPWYCFRCGEDGHIVATCESDPNPALVAAKRKELRIRQQLWESQHRDTPSLN